MKQVLRFILIGGVSALVDLGTMWLCMLWGLHYVSAAVIGFFAGLIVNYSGHARFTFATGVSQTSLLRYGILVGVNLCISTVIVVLVERWLQQAILGKALGITTIAIIGYFAGKHWVFKQLPD